MGDSSLASKVAAGAAWLMLWRLVSRGVGLASTLVMARILVPGDFGLVAMATAFAATVEALSEVGVQDALVRHSDSDRRLFDAAFTIQAGRALMTGAIIALSARFASHWFDEPRLTSMLLVLASVAALAGFENIGIVEFRRAMQYDVQFKLLFWPRLLQFIVTLGVALLLHSYWALVLGILAAKLARIWMTYRVHSYRPRIRIHGWRELAGFSFWTWASCIVGIIWTKVDPFVLGPAIGPAQLGVYLLALELAILPISEIIQPIADALFTGFATAQKSGESSVHHAPQVAAALLICIMPFTIGISCTSGYLVAGLLGPKWAAASTLISIMAWLCLFSPLTWVASAVLVANGHVQRNFYGRAAAAITRLAVLLAAISITDRLDVVAATVTVCVGIESCAFVLLLVGLRGVRLQQVAGTVLRSTVAGAVVLLVTILAGLAWQPVAISSVPALLDGAVIGIAIVVGFFVVLAALWQVGGRPVGAETEMLGLAARYSKLGLRIGRLRRHPEKQPP